MKKRLLITSALMTAVLGASLATGTYAWYAATTGSLTANASSAIKTQNHVSLAAVTLTATWDVSTLVDPTDDDGDTYLWNGSEAVPWTDGTPVKIGAGKLTFASAQLGSYVGFTFNVTISATSKVRVANQDAVLTHVGAYTPGTEVAIGSITIGAGNTITYSSKKASAAATDALHFYYSVSPQDDEGGDDVNDEYGTISVTLTQA